MDIKNKLEEVLERPDKYAFDPQTCRKFVEDNYSWEKVAEDFEKVAIKLISR